MQDNRRHSGLLRTSLMVLAVLAVVMMASAPSWAEGSGRTGLVVGHFYPVTKALLAEVESLQHQLKLDGVVFLALPLPDQVTSVEHIGALHLGLRGRAGWVLNLSAINGPWQKNALPETVAQLVKDLRRPVTWLVDGGDPAQLLALTQLADKGDIGIEYCLVVDHPDAAMPEQISQAFPCADAPGYVASRNGARLTRLSSRSFAALADDAVRGMAAGEPAANYLPVLVARQFAREGKTVKAPAKAEPAVAPAPAPAQSATVKNEGEPLAMLSEADDKARDAERARVEQEVMKFLNDEVHDVGTLIGLLPELNAGDIDTDRLAEFGLGLARQQPAMALTWLEALDNAGLLPTVATLKKGLYQVRVKDADLRAVAKLVPDPLDRKNVRLKMVLRTIRAERGAPNPDRVWRKIDYIYGPHGLVTGEDLALPATVRAEQAREAYFRCLETLGLQPDWRVMRQCGNWPQYHRYLARQKANTVLNTAGGAKGRQIVRAFNHDREGLGKWLVEQAFAASMTAPVLGDLTKQLSGEERAKVGELALTAFAEAGMFDKRPDVAERQVRRLLPGDVYTPEQIRKVTEFYKQGKAVRAEMANDLPETLFHWADPLLAKEYVDQQRITNWPELAGDLPEKEGDGWRGPSLPCEAEILGGHPGQKLVRVILDQRSLRFVDVQQTVSSIIKWMLARPASMRSLDAYLRANRIDVFRVQPSRKKPARYHVINPRVVKGLDASSNKHFQDLLDRMLDGRITDLGEGYPALTSFAELLKAVNTMDAKEIRELQAEVMRTCLQNLPFDAGESSYVLKQLKKIW